MSKYETLAIVLSIVALLSSIGGVLYTVHVMREFRHVDALQGIRDTVVKNVARFNGILTGIVIAGSRGEEPSHESLGEAARLYAEVRDAFNANKHQFSEQDQTEISNALDQVEELGVSWGQRFTAMGTVLELIHKKLTTQ